jgi:hypothetical protein
VALCTSTVGARATRTDAIKVTKPMTSQRSFVPPEIEVEMLAAYGRPKTAAMSRRYRISRRAFDDNGLPLAVRQPVSQDVTDGRCISMRESLVSHLFLGAQVQDTFSSQHIVHLGSSPSQLRARSSRVSTKAAHSSTNTADRLTMLERPWSTSDERL